MQQYQCHRYSGPERRRHRLYITRNTEYHLRDGVCVAVRDKRSNCWQDGHVVLNRKLSGTVRFYENGTAVPDSAEPSIGEALYFGGECQVVTSLLCAVARPAKAVVDQYPNDA